MLGSLGLFFLFAFLTRAVAVPKDVLGERGKGKGTRNEEKERERQKSLGRENEGKLVETQEGGRKRKNKCHARSFRSFQYKCKPQAARVGGEGVDLEKQTRRGFFNPRSKRFRRFAHKPRGQEGTLTKCQGKRKKRK